MYAIGKNLQFEYNGKIRYCHIEEVKRYYSPYLGYVVDWIKGWDCTANGLVGGYRTFKRDKITNVKELK